ncbi:hypothetical protein JB92DRAFT_3112280 [Gautieria morchelliformis]|nr:hypothetical protein JB92DRAFT_3112280 [Gautieria morchelliformis]
MVLPERPPQGVTGKTPPRRDLNVEAGPSSAGGAGPFAGKQAVDADQELDIFRRLVARTERQNALIRKLNQVRGAKRANPWNRDPVSDDDVEDKLPSLVDFLNARVVAPSITLTAPSPADTPSTTSATLAPSANPMPAQPAPAPPLLPMSSATSQPLAPPSAPVSSQTSALPPATSCSTADNPLDAIDLQALIASAGDPAALANLLHSKARPVDFDALPPLHTMVSAAGNRLQMDVVKINACGHHANGFQWHLHTALNAHHCGS